MIAVLVVAVALFLPAPAHAAATRPLETAISAVDPFHGPAAGLAFARTRAAGAGAVVLHVSWRDTAPAGATRPSGFNPSDPADPAYRWEVFDRLVTLAAGQGLAPIVHVSAAPEWAERGGGGRAGINSPDPAELGHFAEAAARRYSGTFGGLPRVRAWEVWSEPNASFALQPQRRRGRDASPELYRRMVNAFADAVHQVHADNQVIAGGLFPFVIDRPGGISIGPLRFMRSMLCLTRKLRPRRRCTEPARFDIWSHHPYTSGGPTHRAGHRDAVSIRELPRMRRVLAAGVRRGRVISAGPVRFWVTEFGWDSRPPDPHGVPARLHARWVAEALYRMWRAGVTLVAWFQLRDDARGGQPYSRSAQSGLYIRCAAGPACDRPKPALAAFRFPFVAFRAGARVAVWGRSPDANALVDVEQRWGGAWRTVARLRSNGHGIFVRRLRSTRRGPLRARVVAGGAHALPFSLSRPRDRTVNPFG